MLKTATFLLAVCLTPLSVWAGGYTVYSWNPGANVAVRSADCRSFAEAREAADVLAALHAVDSAPLMDSRFSMISSAEDPLTTWVVQSEEPFEPHEYFWVGKK